MSVRLLYERQRQYQHSTHPVHFTLNKSKFHWPRLGDREQGFVGAALFSHTTVGCTYNTVACSMHTRPGNSILHWHCAHTYTHMLGARRRYRQRHADELMLLLLLLFAVASSVHHAYIQSKHLYPENREGFAERLHGHRKMYNMAWALFVSVGVLCQRKKINKFTLVCVRACGSTTTTAATTAAAAHNIAS